MKLFKFRYYSMTDTETKITFSPGIETRKRFTEFRSRAVRSNSCSTKIQLNVKKSVEKTAQKKEKKKIILNVPKKKLKLQRQNDMDLVSMHEIKSRQNNSQCLNNQHQMGENDQLQIEECQFQSKATMKNGKKIWYHNNQHEQLKNMIVELADNHQQMMEMLKQIIKKEQKQGSENSNSPVSNQNKNGSEQKKRESSISSCIQSKLIKNLKINRVINEVIDNKQSINNITTSGHEQKFNNSIANQMKKSKREDKLQFELLTNQIPSFVANMLVDVLSDPIHCHKNFSAEMNLRELLSRRFQAFNYSYNYFMELLVSLNCMNIHASQLSAIFKQTPFLLDEQQIGVIFRIFSPKNSLSETFKVSDLCQKMRYFIEDRQLSTKTGLKLRINQVKSILSSKKNEIIQALKRNSDGNDSIELKNIQKILAEFRLENTEIQVLMAKLCVISKNINQIKYSQIFDFNWLDNQAIIF